MAIINIYLTFNGNCEEAFNFYKSILGGEFDYLSRFNEMPRQEGMPPVSEEEANRIMHVALPVSKETILMGSDTAGSWGDSFRMGNNFSISINTDTKAEADRLFAGLSSGGAVIMPMTDVFWGSYFGMLTDRFGINWQVSAEPPR